MIENEGTFSKQQKTLLFFGLLILVGLLSFLFLSCKTLESHECFVSITAREMLGQHEWFFPTMNNIPRVNKTPLPYWLVAACGALMGNINEFSARFPSAVFSVLSVLTIVYFVNRFASFRTAILSAAVWSTTLAYLTYSRNARSDMILTYFVLLCFLSFYAIVQARTRRQTRLYTFLFWMSFALANLAKGPAPVPLVGIPLAVYILLNRKWSLLKTLFWSMGPAICFLIVAPWPLYILIKMHGSLLVFRKEFVDRLFGGYSRGDYPVYFYFLIMFKYITPWFVFLPIALLSPLYRVWQERRPFMLFLWIWFVADFVFLTLNPCRRQHYLLSSMPAAAILIGIVLEEMAFGRTIFSVFLRRRIFFLHGVIFAGVAAGGSLYVFLAAKSFLSGTLLLSVVSLAGYMIVLYLFRRERPGIAIVACFAGLCVAITVSNFYFLPRMDENKGTAVFAEKIAAIVPDSASLIAYKEAPSRFVHYFGRTVDVVEDEELLRQRYEQGDWIVAFIEHLPDEGSFRPVYRAELKGGSKPDSGGVLFHKED